MSKPKAFFLPGKTGDALLQWAVADLYLKEQDEKAEVWLDQGSCKILVPLFEAQPRVTAVKLVGPSENYACGGQPWQGKFTTEQHIEYEIVPMGFRQFPARQITLQTALDFPFKVDTHRLATEVAFDVGPIEKKNICVVHGTFQSHTSGTPRFWKFFYDVQADLLAAFDRIVFTGSPSERARATELYHGDRYDQFDDHSSFLELARYMAGASLVVGSGSSGCALGSVLKVPTIRIHDPIGEHPKVIWSGLGDNQWNLTEVEARKAWPKLKRSLLQSPEPSSEKIPTLTSLSAT
jgi:hypothetical protein